MTDELQVIIGEVKTFSPDVTNALVFKRNGETLATSESTTPEQAEKLIVSLNSVTNAECIGGIETLIIQDSVNQLSITAVESVYLATVSSRTANQKIVKSLTQVVVPAVIRLAYGTASLPLKNPKPPLETALRKAKPVLPIKEKPTTEPSLEPQASPEPIPPKEPITSESMNEDSTLSMNSWFTKK